MPLTDDEMRLSPGELLSRALHEFAQPLSALSCTLELALGANSNDQRRVAALEEALHAIERLSRRLSFFRDLSEALHPCDCLRPLNLRCGIAAAMEQTRELADSLGVRITTRVDDLAVYGNQQKLQFALVRLLDWFFHSGGQGHVQFVCEGRTIGDLQLSAVSAWSEASAAAVPEQVRAALHAMGAEIHLETRDCSPVATISFSSHLHPEATTAVLLGDF